MMRPRRRVTLAGALSLAALTAVPAANAAWVRPADGPSPINHLPTQNATDVSVAQVAGVPYVAWRELDGGSSEVRVSRLTPTGWQQVGATTDPASPVNRDSLGTARDVAIADVNGIPYVAWIEGDGTNDEVRVARPTADGAGWEEVGTGRNAASPINWNASRNAVEVAIIGLNGVPYVAWTEADGTNTEMRAARLNADGSGWEPVGATANQASPINRSPGRDARNPSLASIQGVPTVAWSEEDGTNTEIRVAQLNAQGTDWVGVGERLRPGSPINQRLNRNAVHPSLAEIDGRPYVAWLEAQDGGAQVRVARLSTAGDGWEKVGQLRAPNRPINAGDGAATAPALANVAGAPWVAWSQDDGRNREVRVARLNSAGTGWGEVVGGANPINVAVGRDASPPTLAAVEGVPYVGWAESDGQNQEARVARLEPRVITSSATATDQTVRFTAQLQTFGLPYNVGFNVDGPGGPRSTRPGPLSGDPATTTATLTSVQPGSVYRWNVYWTMGAGLTATGPTQEIRSATVAVLRVKRVRKAVGVRAGNRTGVKFHSNVAGVARVELRRGSRVVKKYRKRVRVGVNIVRIRAPKLAGRYSAVIRVAATGGRRDATVVRVQVLPKLARSAKIAKAPGRKKPAPTPVAPTT